MNFKSMSRKITCVYLLASFFALATTSIHSSFIEVTSEDDSGAGTLRQAIIDANIFSDFILFAPNVTLIKLLSPLPIITSTLTIDALAIIVDGKIVAGDCDSLPSPVCDPEGFSALLPVTIDGSSIPSTEPFSGFGLRTTSSPQITGLKIQNFTGSSVFPDTIGINGGTGTTKPFVSCCEVSNILSGPTQINVDSETITTSGDAIGINNAERVERCLVRNIKIPSVLNPGAETEPILATGNAIGINNFVTVDQCNVNHINGGDIFANNNQSGYTFLLGQTVGFGVGITEDSTDRALTITGSVATDIHGGSICTNYSDSSIFPINNTDQLTNLLQYNTCGVFINSTFSNITIDSSTFCNIQTGTVQTCGDTVNITTPFAAGIFARGGRTSINNNTITFISGNHVSVKGMGSTALLSSAAGIVSIATEATATSNTISNITAGNSRIDGECSRIFPQLLFIYFNDDLEYFLPPAIGFLHFDDLNNLSKLATLQNNQISIINGGTHSAHGLNASISSTGSVGAATVQVNASITTNNTIKNIIGSTLTASHAALIARNIQASAGLQLLAHLVESHDNKVNSVYETSIQTSGTTPTINGFNFDEESEDSTTIFPIFTSGIYIDGLPFEATVSSDPDVSTTNNTITNITGSATQSNGSTQGSIASGIFFRRPVVSNPEEECFNNTRTGVFENNTISTVTGGTNAPAYGILLNQDLHLQNLETFSFSDVLSNTISTIKGQVLAPYTLTQEELIAECLAGSGSEGGTILTILPRFPYGPSAGINLFASGCASVKDNAIEKVSSSDKQARGIGTVASSDVEISGNSITTITGPGIFVDGASADSMLITQAGLTTQEFEDTFPSVRNKIFDNSTSADMTQGIELGVVNWNNYLASITGSSSQMSGSEDIVVVGNHDQVAPTIKKVRCNSNGTTTIDITFSDKNHQNSTFIIQFFRNRTDTVPHGEQAITPFTKNFEFATDEDGVARARFVFVPAHKINKGDIISAHVTLIIDGSMGTAGTAGSEEVLSDIGDTSEFAVETSGKKQSQLGCITSCNNTSKERTNLNSILSCKR